MITLTLVSGVDNALAHVLSNFSLLPVYQQSTVPYPMFLLFTQRLMRLVYQIYVGQYYQFG